MPVKNHSNEELEKIAEDFLAKWGQGKYDNRCLRIEALIEAAEINGQRYTIFPVRGLAEIAEAYTPAKPGYIFIDEDQFLNDGPRCRFTLAEELAHILIHRPLFDGRSVAEQIKIQEGFSDYDYQVIERNAKFLASCILMPRETFTARFKHFFGMQSARVTNTVQIHRYVIKQLNYDFYVSYFSIALRALQLSLIDQEEFNELNEEFGWTG